MRDVSTAALPRGWVWATVGDVVDPEIEQQRPGGDGDFPYIDISSIDNESKRITKPKTIPVADAPRRARQHVLEGDVLVSMTRPNLNAVAQVPATLGNAIASTGFCVLRTVGADSRLLYYLVQTAPFVEEMSRRVTGALYPAVRPGDIYSYAVPVPPLPEQHRIIAEIEKHFTRLDAAVAALKRARANLKRYRAAVLKAACEGRLVPTETELARAEGRDYQPADVLLDHVLRERRDRWEAEQLAKMQAAGKPPKDDRWKAKYKEPGPPDASGLPGLPGGWVWASIDQLALDSQNGLSKRRAEEGTPTRVLRLSDIVDGRLNEEEPRFIPLTDKELASYTLNQGDIVCIRVNGSRHLVGRLIPFRSTNLWAYCDHFIRLIPDSSAIQAKYLSACGEIPNVRRRIELNMVSSAGQNTISQATLLGLPIPIAPLVEQHRIVAEVERRLSVADELERVIERGLKRAERLRQSVLKRAFRGKLVPQDPDDEPASVLLERIRAERVARAATAPRSARRSRRSSVQAAAAAAQMRLEEAMTE